MMSMQPSATGSFLKFVLGFMTFIGISFGVTVAVSQYSASQTLAQHAAAAQALMLQR